MEDRKTVVVTGASRGIGHATAALFLERGWQIITCARSAIPVECRRDPHWSAHIVADLALADGVEHFVAEARALIGPAGLHGLVNNAGISPKTPYRERLGCLNGDLAAWQAVFDLNFVAPLKLGRKFASALHAGKGAIVNVTSIAGHRIHPFAGSAYSVSKAALSALTREMANEFADLGVRVNAVAPGEIVTDMVQPEYDALIPRIPMGKMGTADDVARAIYYLCSEESTYVTGTELWVTGGQHM